MNQPSNTSGRFARVAVERCYDMRVKAIIAFNTATRAGKDLDDALDAAWQAQVEASPQPPINAGAPPDIPPGCQMARGWCVTVSVYGDTVLTIEDGSLSSLKDLEPWVSTIQGCARHVLSFLGDQVMPSHRDPLTQAQFMEGWYQQTKMTLGNDRWLALRAKDVTERLHGIQPMADLQPAAVEEAPR